MIQLKKQLCFLFLFLFSFVGILFFRYHHSVMAMNNGHVNNGHNFNNSQPNQSNFELQAHILQDMMADLD
ncbi:MAG: SVM family protein [Vigna little leaf phytoplasma]|nr:SVM family protein [Vigna little leaf phytoplasma]